MRILLAAMLLTSGAFAVLFGCSPELADAISDVKEATPSVCKQYCREMYDCIWDEDGSEEDNAMDDAIEECIVSCGLVMKNGAYITDYDGDYIEHVSGSKMKAYLKCMWSAEVYDCEDDMFYADTLEDEDNCEAWAECADNLGADDYPAGDIEWDDDYDMCMIDIDDMEDMTYLNY